VKEQSLIWIDTRETKDNRETSNQNSDNNISMTLHRRTSTLRGQMTTESVTAEANEVSRACHQSS
jgi:osmotically-inducible protein OsmY